MEGTIDWPKGGMLLFLEGALFVGNLDGKQVIPCSSISFAHQLSENMFVDLEIVFAALLHQLSKSLRLHAS